MSAARYRRQQRYFVGGGDRIGERCGLAVEPDPTRWQNDGETVAKLRRCRVHHIANGGAVKGRNAGSRSFPDGGEKTKSGHEGRLTTLRWLLSNRRQSAPGIYSAKMVDRQFLIVRHGQSEWNAQGRWQGQADPPLTALGVAQAHEAAETLSEVGFTGVVSSNLDRAHTTASVIASELGLPDAVVEPLLAERSAGEWSGLTKAQIEAQYPGYLDAGRRPPGYESDEDLLPRILSGVDAALRTDTEKLVIVAHGGVIYMLESHLGAGFQRIGNLGARWFTVDDRGQLGLGERWDLITEATIPDQI